MEMQEDPKLISSNRHTKSATTYGRLLSENSRHLSLPSGENRPALRRVGEGEMWSHHRLTASSATDSQEGIQKPRAS